MTCKEPGSITELPIPLLLVTVRLGKTFLDTHYHCSLFETTPRSVHLTFGWSNQSVDKRDPIAAARPAVVTNIANDAAAAAADANHHFQRVGGQTTPHSLLKKIQLPLLRHSNMSYFIDAISNHTLHRITFEKSLFTTTAGAVATGGASVPTSHFSFPSLTFCRSVS